MATETGGINLTPQVSAAQQATNYLTTITGTNGISVHSANDTSNYINITSNTANIVTNGESRIRAYIDTNDNNTPKIRVGTEDAGRGIFSPSGIDIFDEDSVVASFGEFGGYIGRPSSSHFEIHPNNMILYNSDNHQCFSISANSSIVNNYTRIIEVPDGSTISTFNYVIGRQLGNETNVTSVKVDGVDVSFSPSIVSSQLRLPNGYFATSATYDVELDDPVTGPAEVIIEGTVLTPQAKAVIGNEYSSNVKIENSGVEISNTNGIPICSFSSDGIQIGKNDESHLKLDYYNVDVFDESNSVVASFGKDGAQIGRNDSTHAVVDLQGLSVFDSERSAAHFGIDGSRIYGPDSVPLFNIDTDGSVKTLDVVIGAPSADEGFLYENVTLSKTVIVPEFENGTSVSLRPTGQFFYGFETNLLVKFATNSQTSRTYDISDATISSSGITLRFSNLSSSGIQASSIVLTAGTPMSAYGTVNGIKYGTTSLVLCTIDYRFDVLYDGDSSITFTHTISVERSPLLSTSELTYNAWYMSIAGTAQIKSPSYSIGTRFEDSGDYSAIIGEGLIASSDNQTALGKYNKKDSNDTYALIIGNGTSTSNRFNAFTVGWNAATKLWHPSIQRSTAPSSAIYGGGGSLELADHDGSQIGYFQPMQLTDGSVGIQIGVSNEDGTNWNNIQLTFNGSTPGVSVSHKEEWRNAIGAAMYDFYQATGASGTISTTAGTITPITLVTTDAVSNGSGFSISNGGIKVANAGKYRVTASVYILGTNATFKGVYVKKNNNSTGGTGELIGLHYPYTPSGVQVGPKVVSLEANDVLYLCGRMGGVAGTIYTDNKQTYLLVERIA